jgi:hypothetical protein
MFDVEHLCSHYILVDLVDIAHDYQKYALCIKLYPGWVMHVLSRLIIPTNCSVKTANSGHLENNPAILNILGEWNMENIVSEPSTWAC